MNIKTSEQSTGRRSVLLSPGARHLNSNNNSSFSPYQSVNTHLYYHPPVHSPPISGGTFHPAGRLTSPRSPLSSPISMGPMHRLPQPSPPPSHSRLHTGTPPLPLYRSVFPGQHRSTSHAYHSASSCAPVLSSGHHQHMPIHASPHSSGGNIDVGAGPPLLSPGHTCYQRQHHYHQHHYVSPPLPVFAARAQANRHVTASHQPLVSTASFGGQRLPSSLHPHFLPPPPPPPPPHHHQRYHHTVSAPCGDPAQTCSAEHDEFGCLLSAGLVTSFSQQFPRHSSDCGWVGMLGRPLVGLVECLMEAAVAVVVERHTDGHCCCLAEGHQQREGAEQQEAAASAGSSLSATGRSPSFYICLAIRISLLSMFQQRRVSASLTRLSSGLCQEARLLSLLSTVPKDETALRAICETVCQLLGPPPSQTVSPERSGRLGVATGGGVRSYSVDPLKSAAASSSSAVPAERVTSPHWFWWWSQLGPQVHADSHPVHAVANFILNYLQEEAQYFPLSQTGVPCDPSVAGWASFGIDNLLMAVLTRAIRFSTLDQLSDGAGSLSSTSYRTAASGGGNPHSSDPSTGNANSQLQRGWQSSMENAFPHNPADSSHPSTGAVDTSGAPSLSRWDYPYRLGSHLSTSGRSPPLPSTMVASILSCLSPLEAFADYYRGYAQSCKEAESQCLCSSSSTSTMEQVNRSVGRSPLTDSSGHQQHHRPPRHPFEMLESRQAQLAVALIRYTRFHIHRLDHVVQLCSRYIRSASSLGTISQQVFSDLIVGTNVDSWCSELHLLTPSGSACRHHHFSPVKQTPAGHCPVGRHHQVSDFRLHLLCTAFHLAILAVMRANSSVSHRRRRELLVWMLTLALHVGPPACLHLLTRWQRYATPWEAVYLIAPTLLMVVPASPSPETAAQQSRTQLCPMARRVSFGPVTVASLNGVQHQNQQRTPVSVAAQQTAGEPRPQRPLPGSAAIHSTSNPIMLMADELLVRLVLPIYSAAASDQITAFVKFMAMQAASKDPVNCAIPALALAGGNTSNFDVVYRTVVASAEAGALGSSQLFTLARYMESRGWTQRALPFAVHAVRLFTLTSTQDNYSGAGDVLWACSLAQRLGPWALQQVLAHVVRNIHCPILLTDILYRCRVSPPGSGGNHGGTAGAVENPPPNSNCGYPSQAHGKQALLSLDRMPLKGLLDAAIWAYFTETHARLANISPRQYSEFIEFLTRARDTFGLLRPHGPNQFHAMIEGLRQIYRGKRKLVALLSERFG